ncbi:kanamycin nucleotidyltransferase C-terminal domain-containing protein [Paenibacillus gansuensis]|uniref:Kanamycin nucleotidyltransferase C-terminal domain-containing protein n=1 Tax=Paenibacillus gansuensis TaxID=306542 RepID=A0ABW5PN35_9BACL
MNVFDVADILVNHIKANYSEDIAIIAYYGSYAQGTASKRSDLDFFFIPATSKGFQASIQFIIRDISFDFWPISWERAERMALLQESHTTIIADCKLLYVRSAEDSERFMKLRETITVQQELENRRKFVEKSESELRDVYVHLYKLSRVSDSLNLKFCRIESHAVLTKVLHSLALLNQTYYTKGFGKNKDQILHLPVRPEQLESYMNTIMQSCIATDIFQACEQLTSDTLELILAQKEQLSNAPSYPSRTKGFYEEEKGILDKIATACEMNDYDTAYFYAVNAQEEIARFLYFAEKGYWPSELTINTSYHSVYEQAGLPALVSLLDPKNLSQLQAGVELLSSLLENHLKLNGVEINRFQDIEQFQVFLREKTASSLS